MRVDSNQSVQSLPESGRSDGPSPAGSDARSPASRPQSDDQVQFSGAQGQVQALAEQVLQFPEMRQEKVNALRQAVLDGDYQVGSTQIADAVFAHMLVTPAG
jgi:flagellar biosynthesis anti-sigma factor FlgM